MLKFIGWLLTFVFAFTLGAGSDNADTASDSALKQKVQDHMDVIVDESAALVDDVVDEFRQSEYVQDAESFVEDVNEIVDNTRADIRAHFGPEEEPAAEDSAEETVEETAEEVTEETVEEPTEEVAEEAEAGE